MRLQALDKIYESLLSSEVKGRSEKIVIAASIISFLIHLILIALVDLDIIHIQDPGQLLNDPIAATYTPFSLILFYEVYLLVFYLPKSITTYIGKQYEIITLILIRRLFKDLSNLDITSNWFSNRGDLQFTFDLVATLVLFGMIYLFYRMNKKRLALKDDNKKGELSISLKKFIKRKKIIAVLLVPVFVVLAFYSLGNWIYLSFFSIDEMVSGVKDVNNVFFDEFFTVLILTDVLLLLLSFLHTDRFNTVIRNSGFIISTILIRLSFGVEGLINTVLITVAVVFGVIIMWIHLKYKQMEAS